MENSGFVFYVDDDPDDRLFFEEIVQSLGVKLMVFDCVDRMMEALANINCRPAIIFTDLNMPKISGYELLLSVRSNAAFNDVPVVVVSTSSNETSVQTCYELGANLYLIKANSIVEMRYALQQIININWEGFNPDKKDFIYRK